MVHEQPPQPSWPISTAALHCSSAVCMQQGAGPGAVGQAYAQEGAWWGSQQVRCVSAPWTSAVGLLRPAGRAGARRSARRADHAAAHQRRRRRDAGLAGTGQPRGAARPARRQPDAVRRHDRGAVRRAALRGGRTLERRASRGAAGRPNWFGAGGGLLVYGVTGAPGAARSFQLTYTLSAADLGSRLRCVAGADDGPVSAPTTASFASPNTRSRAPPPAARAGSAPPRCPSPR